MNLNWRLIWIWSLGMALVFGFHAVSGQQDSVDQVAFNQDYKFNDGLFFTFEQVKLNNPLPRSRFVSETYIEDDQEFYNALLKEKTIAYYDENGILQKKDPSGIWGYAHNGSLFVMIQGEFNKITIMGSICYFFAIVNDQRPVIHDPVRNPYYDPYYSPYPTTSSTKEMRQFLLDFNTGKIMDYDYKSLEALLMQDQELYDEYNSLKRREKRKLKFLYIRKFNERNPLYLPKQ